MKKIIIAAFIVSLFTVSAPVHAATKAEIIAQRDSIIRQVISLLEQQVADLQQQLAALSAPVIKPIMAVSDGSMPKFITVDPSTSCSKASAMGAIGVCVSDQMNSNIVREVVGGNAVILANGIIKPQDVQSPPTFATTSPNTPCSVAAAMGAQGVCVPGI